ncbi:MAG: glutamine-hydrolyzing carbamoyl-phosphate synthase small subunit [Victivallaceae bacterium]|nr:glutamine-hydrolyzing carbamoyl-phosphate synthase small subunit [Victivallaceae bacterium]
MTQKFDWEKQRAKAAFLALENGIVLRGYSVGAPVDREGEVVFNTGLTGYQEIVSDPSYAGQFVTMTYPEIGNYGFNAEDMESRSLFLNGFIIHNMNEPSNFRSEKSLADALKEYNVPAIAGIDTRHLTTILRSSGTMRGCLHCSDEPLSGEEGVARAAAWAGLDDQDYVCKVSCSERYEWDRDDSRSFGFGWPAGKAVPPAEFKVVAYDFGIKYNILRMLRRSGMRVTVVPARTPAAEVLALNPDGVFLSNGPADPAAVTYAIDAARELLGRVPLMGICLGHQLLGLACGGRRFRLKFGHHGCNHPVLNLATGKVEITSQNHNFGIAGDSLPDCLEITHVNLNDRTVEGLRHKTLPMFAVQYHPEAAPGPHDPSYLFEQFAEMMRENRKK